ncbi:MAG: DUF1800 domain-containing protein [Phormidesmis sp.]
MDTSQKITHVLDRLSFGPRPGDRQRVSQLGVDGYIQSQLNPSDNSAPASLTRTLREFPSLTLSPVELFEQYPAPKRDDSPERSTALRQKQATIVQEALQAKIRRSLESPNQLQEVMVDFWFNHFNVYIGKGLTKLWVGAYERMAMRTHAMGTFRDLLGATAKHPAMAFYLDNWRNTDPDSPKARGPYRGLNENYARELMELHTLGVDGGYTQADVENLTRILTGWGIVRESIPNHDGSGFRFEADRHDGGDKRLLGELIPGGGVEEGERALDLLAQHPSTARHISYRLAQYFVSDAPPETLVDRMAERFLATEGDITQVLRSLFDSDEFWADASYQTKFKTPYQYLISAARATGLSSPDENAIRRLIGVANQLGMPVYSCRTPNGYAQIESAWLNADAMLRRVGFARAIINLPAEKPTASALLETLGDQFSSQTLSVINSSPAGLQPALIAGSPEMMYR